MKVAPSVDFNATSSSGAESASSKALTVDLSAASGRDVTVAYAITGTATGSGTDFTLANGTLTISAGDTSGTITIASIINDTLDEANETVIVTLSSPGNATLGSDKTHTYTINDNDATPSLSINDVSGNETAGNREFTVTLSAASGLAVTVNYATSNGTATAGADYTAISATTLTFSPGQTTKTFNVAVLADSLDEANETATLTLSGVSSTATISDATATLTITDDDATPSLSINDVTDDDEDADNSTFTVTLSAASGLAVTVNYVTSNGTATAGAARQGEHPSRKLGSGATSATFTVAVINDLIDEANETVIVTLSSASNATISDATGTLTITNDDATPSVDFNATSSSGAESASSKALTVDLSAASGRDVTVAYAITGTATGSGTDFTLANGTLTISAGDTSGTITIASIINDTLDEANETVIVTLSSPGNATLGSDKTHTYTINDNDATPSLSINDVSGNETAGNREFTVTLSAASGLAVTVNYATSNGTATAGADYTAISATTLTFSPGQTTKTFNVAVLADSLDEANETATLYPV